MGALRVPAVKALGSNALVLPRAGGYTETFNLVAHRRLLGSQDTALSKFLRAVERAEQFIQHQPDEAKAVLCKRLQPDQAFVDWVWPNLGFRLALDPSLPSTMESEARWALREVRVKGQSRPNFLILLHPAPLGGVKPTAVGIGR
jgi:ABC-type nitrate/sulfonate/bicarbonate transport system substrate-binding protein